MSAPQSATWRIGSDTVVAATHFPDGGHDGAWQVSLEMGSVSTGMFERAMTCADARSLAHALLSAADHYEAERGIGSLPRLNTDCGIPAAPEVLS